MYLQVSSKSGSSTQLTAMPQPLQQTEVSCEEISHRTPFTESLGSVALNERGNAPVDARPPRAEWDKWFPKVEHDDPILLQVELELLRVAPDAREDGVTDW